MDTQFVFVDWMSDLYRPDLFCKFGFCVLILLKGYFIDNLPKLLLLSWVSFSAASIYGFQLTWLNSVFLKIHK